MRVPGQITALSPVLAAQTCQPCSCLSRKRLFSWWHLKWVFCWSLPPSSQTLGAVPCAFSPGTPYHSHSLWYLSKCMAVGEGGAALTRLRHQKKPRVPQCRNTKRWVFSSATTPHTAKLMGLITAVPLLFILKHEKHFYSMNSKHILQLAGRFQAYQDKLQLQSHNLIFNTQMRGIQHHYPGNYQASK